MTKKALLPVLLVPTFLLVIPLVANFTVEGFDWNPGAFVCLWLVMVAIGVAYKLATHRAGNNAQRLATVIALGAGFMIFWGNLSVGFIGGDDNPANLLYLVVLVLGAIGAVRVRFAAAGMARTMWMMAAGILLVPVIALIVRPHDFSPGVARARASRLDRDFRNRAYGCYGTYRSYGGGVSRRRCDVADHECGLCGRLGRRMGWRERWA